MFNVIIDTREQQPWDFTSNQIEEVIHHKLDTGDYAVQGLEDVLCIERKKSVSELAGNVVDDRFERELVRMSEFPYSFLILEFSIDDVEMYPRGSTIPKKLWKKVRTKGAFIMKRLSQIQVDHGIHVIFADSPEHACWAATNIMKRVDEKRTDK